MRAVILCLVLSGCAAAPKVAGILPDDPLLDDCPHPVVLSATNGQLAGSILAYREALKLCNDDKAALRAKAKGQP